MSMTFLEALSLPDEYMHPEKHLCGLCGQSGVIDTRGKIISPAGVECGVRAYCVCANGRAMKKGEARAKAEGKKVRLRLPETFWVSWEDYSWKDPDSPGKQIISHWESGQAGDGSYATIVAWVIASNVSEVVEAIDKDWPVEGERRWRFINPCEKGWNPGDRFPLSKQAEAKLKKLKESK